MGRLKTMIAKCRRKHDGVAYDRAPYPHSEHGQSQHQQNTSCLSLPPTEEFDHRLAPLHINADQTLGRRRPGAAFKFATLLEYHLAGASRPTIQIASAVTHNSSTVVVSLISRSS